MGDVVEFPLYELTDSLENVAASRGNLRIEFTDVNEIGVQMLLELSYGNVGDRIVMQDPNTAEAHSFTIELPIGARGIAPEAPPNETQRYQPITVDGNLDIPGIQDTQPLVPNWVNLMRVSFFRAV